MIIQLLLQIIITAFTILFSWLPTVSTLPPIAGYDIDGALVTGVGEFKTISTVFWPLQDLYLGFLFLMGYYIIKIILKLFLGHRAPGKH